MASTQLKFRIASAILGPMGMLWIVSIFASFSSLSIHEFFLNLGCGLAALTSALEPAVLFQPFSLSIKELSKRPFPFKSPFTLVLLISSLLCFFIATIAWLIT